MKRIALLLVTMIAFAAAAVCAEVEISFDFFHDSLAPYGDWCEVDGYGYVWHPAGVDSDWTPYSDGYWSYTDAGWTWVSYEDFGGITYHYGRWITVDDCGWCWVPDYEWGPAWVSWRRNDDYVGWAPLPPEARFERRTGFGAWVDVNFEIGPTHFRFCRWRDFGAPVIRRVCEPSYRSVVIIRDTVNITNISYRDDYDCVFNGGFDYDYVAPLVHRPVPALKLVRNTTTNIFVNGNKGNVFINSPRGNALVVAAPAVAKTNYNVLTKKLDVQRKFGKQQVNRGWAGVNKKEDREQLLVKMREETRGKDPKTAPARAPKAESLAVLPKKADFDAKPAALLVAPRSRDDRGKGDGEKPPGLAGQPKDVVDAPRGSKEDRDKLKPFTRPESGGRSDKVDAPTVGQASGETRDGGKGVAKRERPDAGNPAPVIQPDGQPGEDIARKGDKQKGDGPGAAEAAREDARAKAMAEEREVADKQRAAAAKKDVEKQQRNAELAAKEQMQAAEKDAARAAKAQRDAETGARSATKTRERAFEDQKQKAAEIAARERALEGQKQKAADSAARERAMDLQRQKSAENAARERAMDGQKQKAAEAAARERAAEGQRKQADEANRRRAAEAAQQQQRSAEQARSRAMDAQRQQAAESANRQRAAEQARANDQARAAQAAAMQRKQQSSQPPPSYNRAPAAPQPYSAPSGNGEGKGKGKNKDKDKS